MTALIVITLIGGGLEAGGTVAAAFPVASLSRYHLSSAQLGGFVGFSSDPLGLRIGYDFTSLPGHQASAYRVLLHRASLELSYRLLRRGEWGLEASSAGGYQFATRSYDAGQERGSTPFALLGLGFYQTAGSSRLSLGATHSLIFEGSTGEDRRIALTHLFGLRAGVAYVF